MKRRTLLTGFIGGGLFFGNTLQAQAQVDPIQIGYAARGNGSLSAFNMETGSILWTDSTDGTISFDLSYQDERVYVVTDFPSIHIYDTTGNRLDTYTDETDDQYQAVTVQGTDLFVGQASGDVFKYDVSGDVIDSPSNHLSLSQQILNLDSTPSHLLTVAEDEYVVTDPSGDGSDASSGIEDGPLRGELVGSDVLILDSNGDLRVFDVDTLDEDVLLGGSLVNAGDISYDGGLLGMGDKNGRYEIYEYENLSLQNQGNVTGEIFGIGVSNHGDTYTVGGVERTISSGYWEWSNDTLSEVNSYDIRGYSPLERGVWFNGHDPITTSFVGSDATGANRGNMSPDDEDISDDVTIEFRE